MGRQPCCDKVGLKRGPWTIEEDNKLMNFILGNGIQCWRLVPKLAGLMRCGKSCRLRWINYLRPDLKRGAWTEAEEDMIIELHSRLGNRWSKIAAHFPGRTDNEIKNHWNTKIKKKLRCLGLDPLTHKPIDQQENHNGFTNGKIGECSTSSGEEEVMKQESQETSIQSKDLQMQQHNDDEKCTKSQDDHQDNGTCNSSLALLDQESNLPAGVFKGIKQNPGPGSWDATTLAGMNDFQFQLEDHFQNWISSPLTWEIFSTTLSDNFP